MKLATRYALLIATSWSLAPVPVTAASGTVAPSTATRDATCDCPCPLGWQPHCQEACCNPTKSIKCKPSHGTVASRDDAAKSFVVHPKTGADATFMTSDKTSYWNGKKKATWADLAVGDNVHVTCSTMDGTNQVAKTVKISAAK
jgi:hypothetical protein